MTIKEFKVKLKESPKEITFLESMGIIESNYKFVPTAFKNGDLKNEKGQNSGSCKVFAFALREGLSREETLACFGNYYFDEVLNYPRGRLTSKYQKFYKNWI
ncbi:HopJ type III effector protein [Maribacter litopenaei]|uniref:HopJ type III effector protein n=1 Tax=Maribacter litopenaei TaxID=2976127 RepID=UPI003B8485E6